MNKMEKWNIFREKRLQTIVKYIKLKRKQLIINGLLKMFALDLYVRKIYKTFRLLVKIDKENKKRKWLAKQIKINLRNHVKKYGKTLFDRQNREIHRSFTFHAQVFYDLIRRKSIETLRPLLLLNFPITFKIKYVRKQLIFVQT